MQTPKIKQASTRKSASRAKDDEESWATDNEDEATPNLTINKTSQQIKDPNSRQSRSRVLNFADKIDDDDEHDDDDNSFSKTDLQSIKNSSQRKTKKSGTEKYEELKELVKQLTIEKRQALNDSRNTMKLLLQASEERRKAKEEIDHLRTVNDNLRTMNDNLRTESEELRKAKEEIDNLRTMNDTLQAQNNTYKEHLRSVEAEKINRVQLQQILYQENDNRRYSTENFNTSIVQYASSNYSQAVSTSTSGGSSRLCKDGSLDMRCKVNRGRSKY